MGEALKSTTTRLIKLTVSMQLLFFFTPPIESNILMINGRYQS
jgi:hypothetical protein